ncbi:T9SS type B sorting domain-containing protein [Winogradskyella echinorum]|uniref:T9SS type B sorting domain-containing protein n=1 Tax=Winogradskyella echinorum TaxID=538189 RepID=A0ABR6Y3D4_9FLAO|nr:T9SS type B sorting domain-containing protein [Winogradskyella echinorum]MBC3847257.1 T9SS type B sorting domain-containing protein [Winogradskyella echinorum]MBC5751605.1 T9SS type B sorting domain-containing protein [Winogradskyella echinorum]
MIIKPNLFLKPILLCLICFVSTIVFAQEPNDCQFAVTVCGNSNFSFDVNGRGVQELAGSNTCSSQENNSIWLQVNIENSGTLAFTLTPNSTSINEDYDFFIFGPNVSCGNIGQAIRCSTTNPAAANQGNNLTGMNATSTETSEGPGQNGDSFVSDIDVLAGESYFIVIDRPIGNSPFSLEWTGTATFPEEPSNPLALNTTTLPNLNVCDAIAPFDDNITEIDLTDLTQDIINGESDIAVTYHNTESDANIKADALGNIFNTTSGNQTVYIRIENTITGCFIINDFDINITEFNNFNTPTDYEVCDDDTDGDDQNGITTFDFNIKSQEIVNGIAGANYNITYYLSEGDAETSSGQLPNIYTNTTPTPTEIFARIEDLDSGCVGFTSFNIIVAEKPIANDVSLIQCDEDGIPEGFTTFNITEAFDAITDNNLDATVEYYLSQVDAENQENAIDGYAFDNFFNPQIIYTRVTNANTGCVNYSEISLEVSLTSSNNASIQLCDTDGNEDGFMSFNLNDTNAIVLAGAPAGLNLQYFETYEDALVETNPLASTFTNTIPYNQTIYARVENANACYGISQIELTVLELPNIETEAETHYCLNFFPETIVLDGGVINDLPNNYSYLWSTGEDTATIEVNAPGNYTVRVFNANNCFKDRTITVLPSNIATITDVEIIDASQNNSISVLVSGEGDYEFAIDDSNGPYQDSNTFSNLQPGLYTVFVRDKNNCGITEELVSVIGFPKFFTPNDDSKNDYWQVKGISSQFQANSSIFIFNRNGKLLKELDPLGSGWDGTFNGVKMPTSDYWFKVKLQDGRTFTSHFTLKR